MNERDDFTVPSILRTFFLSVLAVALCPRVHAEETQCTAPSPDCAVVGKFEISASFGLGQRSNPVAGRSDIPLVVIPRISYYGERFFLENLELGFTVRETASSTFNLIATPGYDRVFFYRNDLQNIFIEGGTTLASGLTVERAGLELPVPRRRTTYLAGPEWTFSYGALTGQFNALREVTGRHDGYEVRGALALPLIRSQSSLVASAGFTWKSAELVRYYYGVDRLYEPGSSFSPFVKLGFVRPVSDRWTVNAFAHYEALAGAISNSPLVSENHVTTVFAGVVFRIR